MRASRRGAALGALLALALCLLLPAAAPVRADELLVMPYACEISGGRPRLTPGAEQGYRIVGEREQRRFEACSPANPGMCRRWTVYRFDLDCDGERVSWVEVVAAADTSGRRARLVDGRLELRMPPRWGLAQDDPCASEPGGDGLFPDRRRERRCAERLARAPAVVEMPRGFAPMLGIDAIFVRAAPGVAKSAPPESPVGSPWEVEAGAEQAQPLPSAEPPPSRPAGEATAKRTPPPAAAPPPPPPQGVQEANSKVQPPAPLQPPPAKERAPSKDVAALSPLPAGPPPKSPPPSGSPPPPPPAKQTAPTKEVSADSPPPKASLPAGAPPPKAPPPETKPASKVEPAPPAPKREAAPQPPPPPARPPQPVDDTTPSALFSFRDLRTPTVGAIVAFTGLTLGLLIAAFAAARRRERPQPAAGRYRRARGRLRLAYDDGSGTPPADRGDSPLDRVPGAGAADAALAALGERVPQTRKEAFELLAAGIGRRADLAAIKKIVDALRKAWYPDWANDEADRQLRELRSKQINAAWDLLQDERAGA
jgi:hypothetical protein